MPNYSSGEEASYPVFEEGEYPFETISAKESTSKAKNTQIELILEFSDGNGTTVRVFDYLVFTKGGGRRIDDYRVATGDTLVKGEASFEAEDCPGRSGRAYLVIDEYNGKRKNKVGYYIVPNGKAKKPAKSNNPF